MSNVMHTNDTWWKEEDFWTCPKCASSNEWFSADCTACKYNRTDASKFLLKSEVLRVVNKYREGMNEGLCDECDPSDDCGYYCTYHNICKELGL